MNKQRFEIGLTFTVNRKNSKQTKTIVDVYKTYNSAGDLVDLRYVCTHDFMGQKITEYDVVDPQIARALFDQYDTVYPTNEQLTKSFLQKIEDSK